MLRLVILAITKLLGTLLFLGGLYLILISLASGNFPNRPVLVGYGISIGGWILAGLGAAIFGYSPKKKQPEETRV